MYRNHTAYGVFYNKSVINHLISFLKDNSTMFKYGCFNFVVPSNLDFKCKIVRGWPSKRLSVVPLF